VLQLIDSSPPAARHPHSVWPPRPRAGPPPRASPPSRGAACPLHSASICEVHGPVEARPTEFEEKRLEAVFASREHSSRGVVDAFAAGVLSLGSGEVGVRAVSPPSTCGTSVTRWRLEVSTLMHLLQLVRLEPGACTVRYKNLVLLAQRHTSPLSRRAHSSANSANPSKVLARQPGRQSPWNNLGMAWPDPSRRGVSDAMQTPTIPARIAESSSSASQYYAEDVVVLRPLFAFARIIYASEPVRDLSSDSERVVS
jgi:hypothetical protein